MNNFLHSSETILDFLTLMEVEQKTSNLFNAAIWQDLNQLDLALNNIRKPDEIASAILDWCEKYPQIMDEFNETNWSQLRGDMFDEDKPEIQAAPPSNEADIIRNRDRIQKTIQDNQPNPDNTPANPPEN